jgi:hypothetical protein
VTPTTVRRRSQVNILSCKRAVDVKFVELLISKEVNVDSDVRMSITESSNEGDPIFKIRKFVCFEKKKQSKQRNINEKSQLNNC